MSDQYASPIYFPKHNRIANRYTALDLNILRDRLQVLFTKFAEQVAMPYEIEHVLSNIRIDMDKTPHPRVDFSIDQSWSIGCSITARFAKFETLTLEQADGTQKRYHCFYQPELQIGWSSTGRNVSAATAAIELYSQAVKFAALIETVMDEMVWFVEAL